MNLYKALKSANFETQKVLKTVEEIAQKENSKEILANSIKSILKAIEYAEKGFKVMYLTNNIDFTIFYLGLNLDFKKNKSLLELIEIEESETFINISQIYKETKIVSDFIHKK